MKRQKYDQFINGAFIPSADQTYFTLRSPVSGEVIAEVANSNEGDVGNAVQAAQQAFATSPWRRNPELRMRSLRLLAKKIRDALPQLVELESTITGRPIREMRAQLARLPEWYEYYASVLETLEDTVPPFGTNHLNYTRREPIGVVGLITPWNHPLLILTKKLAPALAAGNAVVIKPSEMAPLTVNKLAEIILETGIPKGIVNVVHGVGAISGKALSENQDIGKIDLTGGTSTGRIVAAAGGYNLIPVAAELGGKASVVIFEDADLDEVVNAATFAGYIASGQTCVQGARVLVPDQMYHAFVDRFIRKVEKLRIGNPLDDTTDIGPLISEQQCNRVLEYVRIGVDEGATLSYGGTKLNRPGWYMKPTVFTNVEPDMRIAQEEIFGPVVCVMRYNNEKEAVDLANSTDFGLAMSIWTNDIRRAHRVAEGLEAGVIWINDHHRINPSSPWGGFKDSGLGHENGIDCYKSYTQVKNIVVNTKTKNFDWFDGSTKEKRYS